MPQNENKSISHAGNALILEEFVNGRWCCMTINTGSDIAIARPDVVQKKNNINWNPDMKTQIRGYHPIAYSGKPSPSKPMDEHSY